MKLVEKCGHKNEDIFSSKLTLPIFWKSEHSSTTDFRVCYLELLRRLPPKNSAKMLQFSKDKKWLSNTDQNSVIRHAPKMSSKRIIDTTSDLRKCYIFLWFFLTFFFRNAMNVVSSSQSEPTSIVIREIRTNHSKKKFIVWNANHYLQQKAVLKCTC